MKPKRVAFLLNEFPTLTETFILNQIIFLIEKGIDVHIFSLYRGNFDRLHDQFQKYDLINKVTFIATIPNSPVKRLAEVITFFKNEGLKENLNRLLKCINPFVFGISGIKLTYFLYYIRMSKMKEYDLVHAHFGKMGVFFDMFAALKLLDNLPYLVSFHGFDLVPNEASKNQKEYQGLFHSAKVFTVNSRYTKSLLEKVSPTLNQRIRLLPESLDSSLFLKRIEKNKLDHEKSYKLVFVGRLVAWKGADKAVEILEKLVRDYKLENVELTIIGNGPQKPDLEKMISEKDLENQVKLLGGQNQTVVKSYLNEADLFIYTGSEDVESGRAENQGLVLMEAQAMGVPVVAFEVGGVGEGIQDKVTGILISPGDIDAFAKSVMELLLNPELRKEMGKKARTFVIANFEIQILGQRLLEIYEEVLE